MKPAALLVHVENWKEGLAWYQKAFPEATIVELPEFDFKVLRIGDFTIEVVQADAKVSSGKAGTVLYWEIDDLAEAIQHFRRLGAKIYRGPMPIEQGLSICQVCDPFGNLIGLRGLFPANETTAEDAAF